MSWRRSKGDELEFFFGFVVFMGWLVWNLLKGIAAAIRRLK